MIGFGDRGLASWAALDLDTGCNGCNKRFLHSI